MPYDVHLAERIRKSLADQPHVEEKKMMGGLTFMVNEKMCVGVLNDNLMARIDPEVYEEALEQRGAREMDFTGRAMKGFVFVGPEGIGSKKELDYWLKLALDYNKIAKSSKRKNK